MQPISKKSEEVDQKELSLEGQKVDVKVLEVDRQGRIRLSMKALLDAPKEDAAEEKAAPQEAASEPEADGNQ